MFASVFHGWSSALLHHFAIMCLLGGLVVECSIGLIMFNKFLMHRDRFPYAVPLVMVQVSVSFIFSCVLFLSSPWLFPSLTDPMKMCRINRNLFVKTLMPIAAFFVGQAVLSNTAYVHSSVAFLQMMKECNLVLVYLFSLVVGLEFFRFRNAVVLVLIIVGTTMTIKGEVHFSATGFFLQGTSQLSESLKVVLQGLLLSRAGMKLDALTYVLLMTPGVLLLLGPVLGFLYAVPIATLAVPGWAAIVHWWPLLLLNACVAFVLNVICAVFLMHSSPLAYILIGILKDALVVVVGTSYMGDNFTHLQAAGFTLQLTCIVMWMMMKMVPQYFEDGMIKGFGLIAKDVFAVLTPWKRPQLWGEGAMVEQSPSSKSPSGLTDLMGDPKAGLESGSPARGSISRQGPRTNQLMS